MKHILRLLTLSLLLVMAAACGGPTNSPQTSPASSPWPSLPVAPTLDPAEVHAFPDLEARLPKEVNGASLVFNSYAALSGEAASGDLFAAELSTIGHSSSELQMAIASPVDENTELVILAFRLPGLQGSDLAALLGPDNVAGTVTPGTLASKSVLVLTEGENVSYAYASGDVLFLVAGSSELVSAALDTLH